MLDKALSSLILFFAVFTLVFAASLPISSRRMLTKRDWFSPEYKWIFEYPLPIPPTVSVKTTYTNYSTGAVIDYYEISIIPFEYQVYPNLNQTKLVGYNGISPGPTFQMRKGREAVVRFNNNSPDEVSVHVHGQYDRAPFDGWAADTMKPGEYKDYYYPNSQNARSLWYHDHAEYITANNAYKGQEGVYIISDEEEDSLGLPSGEYDVPLVISAKYYNPDGSLNFETNGNTGLWGDIIHVNGQPWPYLDIEPRKYRFRLLDASLSRTYSLSFGVDGDNQNVTFQVVGSDSGLLGYPVKSESLMISPGERYDLVVDFGSYAGKNITLNNGEGISEITDYEATDKVMRFVVSHEVSSQANNGELPSTLRRVPFPPERPTVDKDFNFERDGDTWKINGVGFADIEHRILAKPARGTVEVWNLRNSGDSGTHPVHIHLIDFQILSRTGGRGTVLPYEAAGLKDVVYLAAGETARVIAWYAPWDGVYMFHCHNLIHEDHDMLVGFNVTQLGNWGYDNSTHFIDPMEPEFRPKPQNAADYTEEAIQNKLAWFYSTDAYDESSHHLDGGYPNPTTSASATSSASHY